jgi:hypothetical protein
VIHFEIFETTTHCVLSASLQGSDFYPTGPLSFLIYGVICAVVMITMVMNMGEMLDRHLFIYMVGIVRLRTKATE